MLKIAIVDDEEKCLKRVADLVSCILNDLEESEYDVKTFLNGFTLLDDDTKFDLIVLDIEMPTIDGFKLAEKLKHTELDNNSTDLIYISNYSDYVFSSFKYVPMRFVRKEFLEKEFTEAINSFVSKKNDEYFSFVDKDMNVQKKIELSDVAYFTAFGHDICVYCMKSQTMHTIKRTGNSKINLDYYEEQFSGKGFIRSHKSYLVNYMHIFEIKDNKVIFFNGATALIANRNIKEFKLKYQKLVMR